MWREVFQFIIIRFVIIMTKYHWFISTKIILQDPRFEFQSRRGILEYSVLVTYRTRRRYTRIIMKAVKMSLKRVNYMFGNDNILVVPVITSSWPLDQCPFFQSLSLFTWLFSYLWFSYMYMPLFFHSFVSQLWGATVIFVDCRNLSNFCSNVNNNWCVRGSCDRFVPLIG